VPVSSVNAAARFAELGVARNVAIPVPKPDTPVEIGRPVAFVRVPLDGVPNAPLNVTKAPAAPTLTAKAVATPVPRPEMPVDTGRPVAFVRVADAGVPNAPPTKYAAPVPTSSVSAARRLAEDGVARKVAIPVARPDTPVEIGRPVALVRVPLAGVPRAPLKVTNAPADPTLTAKAAATPVPRPEIPVDTGRPVAFVSVIELGVPPAPLNRTGAPALPMLTARAASTPVPAPVS